MDSPVVSVVIPCYNLGEYVEDAIASVEAQTFKKWELIVVNDGSTDAATNAKLRELAKARPDLRLIEQSNMGLSEARNSGIKAARGELIVCLDADDKLEPEYLAKTVPVLKRQSGQGVAVVTTWLKEFGDSHNVVKHPGYDPVGLLIGNQLHAGSVFTKQAWKEAGGYKAAMKGGYEDWEFWISVTESGHKWACVPEPLFRYRIRQGSMLGGTRAKHNDQYARLYDLHKQTFAKHQKELVLAYARQTQELHGVIAGKNEGIDMLNQEIAGLKVELKVYKHKHFLKILYLDGVRRRLTGLLGGRKDKAV